jgi:hypothetical protein
MAPLTTKESNMDNMEKLTHPIELSGEELDLVAAAGGSQRCGCSEGGGGFNVLSNDNFAVQIGVLSQQGIVQL